MRPICIHYKSSLDERDLNVESRGEYRIIHLSQEMNLEQVIVKLKRDRDALTMQDLHNVRITKREPLTREEYKMICDNINHLSCAVISQKGTSISSYMLLPQELEDKKWTLLGATLACCSFVVLCNSNIKTGVNKLASELVRQEVYGPVIFHLLDDEFLSTHIGIRTFKQIIASSLRS